MNNEENKIDLVGFLSGESNLDSTLSSKEDINGEIVSGITKVATNDHDKLINRDLADQHPIDAITGLKQELMSIKQTSTSNYNILSKKINNKIRTVKDIPSDMEIGDYIFLEIKEENSLWYQKNIQLMKNKKMEA